MSESKYSPHQSKREMRRRRRQLLRGQLQMTGSVQAREELWQEIREKAAALGRWLREEEVA